MKIVIIFFSIIILNDIYTTAKPVVHSLINKRDIPASEFKNKPVDVKPHHLFIGRCSPNDTLLHRENIIVNNDINSYLDTSIRINVEAPVNISCVKVTDQIKNGTGGYPSFVDGGVGHNFVVFAVTTHWGYGFNIYVEIYGENSE